MPLDKTTELLVIQNGIPVRYREEPVSRFLENGRILRAPGQLVPMYRWETEEEKLRFLQQYGDLIDDEVVDAYIQDADAMIPRRVYAWEVDFYNVS